MGLRLRRRWGLAASPHPCTCTPEQRVKSRPLSDLPPGARGVICCLHGPGFLVRRLSEMGFVPATEVEVVRRAPLSDPIEIRIRGYLVSLRREEAALIRVREADAQASAAEPSAQSNHQADPDVQPPVEIARPTHSES